MSSLTAKNHLCTSLLPLTGLKLCTFVRPSLPKTTATTPSQKADIAMSNLPLIIKKGKTNMNNLATGPRYEIVREPADAHTLGRGSNYNVYGSCKLLSHLKSWLLSRFLSCFSLLFCFSNQQVAVFYPNSFFSYMN